MNMPPVRSPVRQAPRRKAGTPCATSPWPPARRRSELRPPSWRTMDPGRLDQVGAGLSGRGDGGGVVRDACPTSLRASTRCSIPSSTNRSPRSASSPAMAVDGDTVAADFRLPTYWCSPNFAWIMAEDMRDALRAPPWARRVRATLADHLFAGKINAAVNAGDRVRRSASPSARATLPSSAPPSAARSISAAWRC